MPAKKDKSKTTKKEGITIVSSFGTSFTPSEVTVDTLNDYLENNNWCLGLTQKQKSLIFTDKFTIEILDPKGEADTELAQKITNMCESVRMWAMMQLGYADGIFGYGIGVFNQVWGYEGSEYRLQDLRYLPAYTFGQQGPAETLIYSELLPGITFNDKTGIEFHQTNDSGQTDHLKTENLFWVKDPSTAGLAGRSIIKPIIPIIEMLKYAWATETQHMNRVGAPILFITIDEPQPASARTDGVSDEDYALGILEKWGKDQGFILRENMTKAGLDINDNANNLEVIEALNKMIITYMSPTSLISGDGQSLGDSSKSRETFFYKYIKGVHTWLEDQWERIPQMYLDKNGYEGYIANIHIPTPSVDRSEIEIQQAKTGFETQSLSINERRKLLGAEPLDETDLKELEDEFARVPTQPSAGFESNVSSLEQTLQKKLQASEEEFAADVLKAIEHE